MPRVEAAVRFNLASNMGQRQAVSRVELSGLVTTKPSAVAAAAAAAAAAAGSAVAELPPHKTNARKSLLDKPKWRAKLDW